MDRHDLPSDDIADETDTLPGQTRMDLASMTDSRSDPAATLDAKAKREAVHADMMGRWLDYPHLLEETYPHHTRPEVLSFYGRIKGDLRKDGRWYAMPRYPRNEDEVQKAFMDMVGEMQNVNHLGHLMAHGKFLDTHATRIPTRDPGYLKPDVFLQGHGTPFPTFSESPTLSWSQCRAVGDIKFQGRTEGSPKRKSKRKRSGRSPEKGKGKDEEEAEKAMAKAEEENRTQLASYVEQIFLAQENRRFVPAFILDELRLQFFIFDRSGAVSSRFIDYHTEHLAFCALILGLLTYSHSDVGFDPTVFYENGSQYVVTSEAAGPGPATGSPSSATRYIVDKTLFHSSRLVSSGTIYWLAHKEDNREARYIIMDLWLPGGCASRTQLLDVTKKIQKGVAHVVHMENVQVHGRMDSISNNRPTGACVVDQIHTRLVFAASKDARLLENFDDTKELLRALKDAVQGLRNLHRSHILHGDIAPYRILIQPTVHDGNHGVILGLDRARVISNPALSTVTLGSGTYQSWNALEGGSLSYLDDLESIYYALCHIVTCFSAEEFAPPLAAPDTIAPWFASDGGNESKIAAFVRPKCRISVHPTWEPPICALVERLHLFFHERVPALASGNWIPDPDRDYDHVLHLFALAIEAVSGGSSRAVSQARDAEKLAEPSKTPPSDLAKSSLEPQDTASHGHGHAYGAKPSPKPATIEPSEDSLTQPLSQGYEMPYIYVYRGEW